MSAKHNGNSKDGRLRCELGGALLGLEVNFLCFQISICGVEKGYPFLSISICTTERPANKTLTHVVTL